jgi:hypothetical protein
MTRQFTNADLEAYLDESLGPADMAAIERELRQNRELARMLAGIHARRDSGVHTLGEIWRRLRISCPTRDQLGSYLLRAMAPEHAEYVDFHIEKVGCRFCAANLADLKRRQEESAEVAVTRRRKYFDSSAGYLRKTP